MIKIPTLERAVRFICEKRSKSYRRYDARVSQQKNVLSVENTSQDQTCSGVTMYGGGF